MMPALTLNGDESDRLWVRAVTLFPRDLDAAQRCFATETVKALTDGADDSRITLSTRTIRLLMEAPSYADLKETVVANTKRAIVAGDVLGAMYLMERFKLPEPSINKAVHVAMQYAKTARYGDGARLAISEPTIRECWEEYKPVAHFWAAFRLAAPEAYPFADLQSTEWFSTFLGVAQGLFEFGVTHIPKRARPRKPILNPDQCWVLPPTVKAKHLNSHRPPNGLIKYLTTYKAPKFQA